MTRSRQQPSPPAKRTPIPPALEISEDDDNLPPWAVESILIGMNDDGEAFPVPAPDAEG